ncbi:MAG TPA: 2-oxo-4-hydroxy-4-carboxy-5-ureidoimidazoline decarboxylase [Pyrinomonadaceae bacterium]|nr:2-oxo-4-hydroxy-4-carboxy-5-ureidoimidazoline decarboxylase [Pyrinomonadaceae bacterium]
MTLHQLNELPAEAARTGFLKCCGARAWAEAMTASRPFASEAELFAKADEASSAMQTEDWLEAFRAHPKIGEKKAGTPQTQTEANWSAQEQSGMNAASVDTVARLAQANRQYEAKFGFIFIVCASGKSSAEMLSLLNHRLDNDPPAELAVAAQEQRKITRLRLEKLLSQ